MIEGGDEEEKTQSETNTTPILIRAEFIILCVCLLLFYSLREQSSKGISLFQCNTGYPPYKDQIQRRVHFI